MKTITFDDSKWKLVPINPSSKQVCMIACDIQGVDTQGRCLTGGQNWAASVSKAERAYKTALANAPEYAPSRIKLIL